MASDRRLQVIIAIFVICYGAIGARLFYLGTQDQGQRLSPVVPPSVARPDILDRNGTTLAMDMPSASIYAEPRRIVDLDEAIE